jgi:predicted dehydrogenase
MPRSLHVALIGQKFMGRAHSNAWSQAPRFFDLPRPVVLDTVAARDEGELSEFADRWGWRKWTARWEDLATNPDLELVDIGTPNHLHAPQALAMLRAGKHVACEKPLAGTLEDARAMRDAAKRAKGSRTFVWFNYRRCPAISLAWQLVREGRLGRILHVRAHYLQEWGGPETPLSWRFQRKLAGSGAHGDLNAHIVDLARFLVGEEIGEVHGAVARTFVEQRPIAHGEDDGIGGKGRGAGKKSKRSKPSTGQSDVDDCVAFLASFEGGATASFEATRLAFGHQNDNSIELNGEKGSLRFAFEDMNLLGVAERSDGGRTGGWKRIMCTSAAHHPYARAWWPDAHVLGYEHGFVNMAADIARALSGQDPQVPLPDFADAYETQRVLEAALLAARERRAVKLGEVR